MTTATTRIIDRSESQLERAAPPQVPAVRTAPLTAMDILNNAVQSGRPIDELKDLMAMAERMALQQAKKEFAEAFAAFKRECPPVKRKTSNPQFKVNRNGVMVDRKFASLDDIWETVGPLLGKHGLSTRWGTCSVANGQVTTSCIVTHAGGHEVEAFVTIPTESKAGCSEQQKYGISMKYAERYSMIHALGLTSCDEDSDGNDEPHGGELITEHEAANLEAAILDVGGTVAKFCQRMQVETLSQLPKSRLAEAHRLIAERREYNKTAANGGRS